MAKDMDVIFCRVDLQRWTMKAIERADEVTIEPLAKCGVFEERPAILLY